MVLPLIWYPASLTSQLFIWTMLYLLCLQTECSVASGIEVSTPLTPSQHIVLQPSLLIGSFTSFLSVVLEGTLVLFAGTSQGTVEQVNNILLQIILR